MSIKIEFFGIAQQRAGTKGLDIEAGTVGQALSVLSERFPLLAEDCFEVCDGVSRLRAAYIANLNGDQFLRDPNMALADGDSLLILAANAGG